jgi:hypothetical protein
MEIALHGFWHWLVIFCRNQKGVNHGPDDREQTRGNTDFTEENEANEANEEEMFDRILGDRRKQFHSGRKGKEGNPEESHHEWTLMHTNEIAAKEHTEQGRS